MRALLLLALAACGDNIPAPDAGCISSSCTYETRPDAPPPIDGEIAQRTCAELGCGPESLPKACKTDPTQCTCHGERCIP